MIEHTGQRASDASQRRIQNAAHLFAQGGAVFARMIHSAARIRVGIATTANHEHRLRSRVLLLNVGLDKTRVIAAEAEIGLGQGRVVAGVTEKDRPQPAFERIDPQERHTSVHQSARVLSENDTSGSKLAPVHGNVCDARPPG